MKDINVVIEDIIYKKVIKFGNSTHVILPKKLEGRRVYILILMENLIKPKIDYKNKKIVNNNTYYEAEITTNSGSHNIWIEKDKIKEMFIRK